MKILAIETSCDETAVALLRASGKLSSIKLKVLKSLVSSQIKIHAPFGGVVPNLAKREHLKNLPILLSKILNTKYHAYRQAGGMRNVDLVAVTVGPGLEPALWVGIEFAKRLAKKWKKPLIGVNHLHGHLYSFLLSQKTVSTKFQAPESKKPGIRHAVYGIRNLFPAIGLLVSGGHTILVLMKNLKEYKKLGETLDDAVGESFDKVARLLGLPYPGGPEIEKLAKRGDPTAIDFPSPMIYQKNYNFSYSGLKTAVLYYLREHNAKQQTPHANDAKKNPWSVGNILRDSHNQFVGSHYTLSDVAASFQKAAFLPLVTKAVRAAKEYRAKSVMIGGGVAANKTLARMLSLEIRNLKLGINLVVPPLKYCLDNAVMIAAAAYVNELRNKRYRLEANGNLNL